MFLCNHVLGKSWTDAPIPTQYATSRIAFIAFFVKSRLDKACISNHFYMFFTRDARDRISWSWTTWQRNPSSAPGALTGSDCLSNLMSVTPGSAKILKQTDRSEWHTSMESEWTCHIIASPFGQTFSCFVRKLSKSHHNSSQLITTHHNSSQLITTHHNLSHTNSSQLHFSHLTHHSSTAHHNSSQLHFWQVHFSSLLTGPLFITTHHNLSHPNSSQFHFSHLTSHTSLITSQLLITTHHILSHPNSSQLHFSHHFSHLTYHIRTHHSSTSHTWHHKSTSHTSLLTPPRSSY